MIDEATIGNSGALTTELYVPGKSSKDVLRELGLAKAIKMSSNENPAGTSPLALEAYAGCAGSIYTYPDARTRELSEKLASRIGCSAEEITVGAGADGVLYNLAMALIDQDDEVVIPEITFPVYETTARIMRARIIKTPMKGLSIDLDAMASAVTEKTKILYLCNPNNPTGDVLPADEVVFFLKNLPPGVITVLDEAYIDFVDPEKVTPSVDLFNGGMKNLVILRTFSKLYGLAGLRVGYGICDRTIVSLIMRVKPPFAVSQPAEQAALAALDDEAFGRRTIEECTQEKEFIYRELKKAGLSCVPSGTNFVLFDAGRTGVVEDLMKLGIIVRSGAGYGLPTWIRVTVGRPEENRLFMEALRRVLSGKTD